MGFYSQRELNQGALQKDYKFKQCLNQEFGEIVGDDPVYFKNQQIKYIRETKPRKVSENSVALLDELRTDFPLCFKKLFTQQEYAEVNRWIDENKQKFGMK
jgi:hypothetical protein